MIVFLSLGIGSVFGQSNKVNLLRDLSKKDNKVYIAEEYIEPDIYPIVMQQMANLGYWKVVNHINDADMVLVFTNYLTDYRIDGECSWDNCTMYTTCIKVFDNQMNFVYRSPRSSAMTNNEAIQNRVKTLPSDLKNGTVSKASPFYVAAKNKKTLILSNLINIIN